MQGIINLCKPLEMTSFQAVRSVRKILNIKKVGHTGTLDPLATGVLPICIGRATKVSRFLVNTTKEYRAELRLGIKTDTLDAGGQILEKMEPPQLKAEVIEGVLNEFRGEIEQIPPMYSAIKQDGQRLYKLARQGRSIERKPRQITIYNLELLEVDLPLVRFKVECSKGSYIRVLAVDIAKKLGSYAHLSFLIRSRVGPFHLKDSISLAELEELVAAHRLEDVLMPTDSALAHYPKVLIIPAFYKLISNGASFNLDAVASREGELNQGEKLRVYSAEGEFLGIYKFIYDQENDEQIFKPIRLFC